MSDEEIKDIPQEEAAPQDDNQESAQITAEEGPTSEETSQPSNEVPAENVVNVGDGGEAQIEQVEEKASVHEETTTVDDAPEASIDQTNESGDDPNNAPNGETNDNPSGEPLVSPNDGLSGDPDDSQLETPAPSQPNEAGEEHAEDSEAKPPGVEGEGQDPETETKNAEENVEEVAQEPSANEQGEGVQQEGVDEQPPPAEGQDGDQPEEGDKTISDSPQAEGETGEQAGSADANPPTDDNQQEPAVGEDQAQEHEESEDKMAAIQEEADEENAKSPVPQSDTFAEGDRPESPVAVGEKLSREGTPAKLTEYDQALGSPPVPGTPDGDSVEDSDEEEEYDEEEEEYEEEEPEYDREQLLEKYHQALAERQQYQEQNYQLQHKLADYFKKKKSDDTRQEADKNVLDQEQRYLKYMANLDELRRQDLEEREIYKLHIEELKDKCLEKQTKVDEERVKFMDFKRSTGLAAVNSRSGKSIQPKDIEQYLGTENRKEVEVVNVRLENIKLKNKLKKKEQALKSKEELAEGLHLIDFEQLKIENQTYNEKIEERNEELLKLRKKITNTVQVLTHLKEKLQYVQAENQVQQSKLREVEELAARKRDILTRTKQARDALRIDNQKLRQNCGLLGNESLLRDFEERKDESDDLKFKLDHLKKNHAELTLILNGIRRKIDQAKQGRL